MKGSDRLRRLASYAFAAALIVAAVSCNEAHPNTTLDPHSDLGREINRVEGHAQRHCPGRNPRGCDDFLIRSCEIEKKECCRDRVGHDNDVEKYDAHHQSFSMR